MGSNCWWHEQIENGLLGAVIIIMALIYSTCVAIMYSEKKIMLETWFWDRHILQDVEGKMIETTNWGILQMRVCTAKGRVQTKFSFQFVRKWNQTGQINNTSKGM